MSNAVMEEPPRLDSNLGVEPQPIAPPASSPRTRKVLIAAALGLMIISAIYVFAIRGRSASPAISRDAA